MIYQLKIFKIILFFALYTSLLVNSELDLCCYSYEHNIAEWLVPLKIVEFSLFFVFFFLLILFSVYSLTLFFLQDLVKKYQWIKIVLKNTVFIIVTIFVLDW